LKILIRQRLFFWTGINWLLYYSSGYAILARKHVWLITYFR